MPAPRPMAEVIEDAKQRTLADPRSDEALLQQASDGDDDDAPGVVDAIRCLHFRGSEAIWQRAAAMTRSVDPIERRRAFNILAQLGIPDRVRPEETLALILDALERERDAAVLTCAAVAVGHRTDERAAVALARHRHHPDAAVRGGVVFGLLTLESPPAIEALLELSRDADVDVRSWATFGLGIQIELDTPEIRAALRDRLSDPDDEVRGEAEEGLARREATPPR